MTVQYNNVFFNIKKYYMNKFLTKNYLSVKSFSLVATEPNNTKETKYRQVVARVAAKVPTGIDR